MCDSENFITKVYKIFYVFSKQGSIEPYISIIPNITLNDGFVLKAIKASSLKSYKSLTIAPGDLIKITKINNHVVEDIEIVEFSEEETRTQLKMSICPICGSKLLYHKSDLVGRCLDRTCGAQIYNNAIRMYNALNINKSSPVLKFLNRTVMLGMLHTPIGILSLPIKNLYVFSGLNESVRSAEEIAYNEEIDRIIPTITVTAILMGFGIDNIDLTVANKISSILNNRKEDMDKLLDEKFLSSHPEINWNSWREFIAVTNNRKMIEILSNFFKSR